MFPNRSSGPRLGSTLRAPDSSKSLSMKVRVPLSLPATQSTKAVWLGKTTYLLFVARGPLPLWLLTQPLNPNPQSSKFFLHGVGSSNFEKRSFASLVFEFVRFILFFFCKLHVLVLAV